MERGRAAVMHEYGKPLSIEEFPVPDPGPDEIIVKIKQAGLCGSDLHGWHGGAAPVPPHGRVMGHEGTGVVWKLGSGRTTDSLGRPLAEGERIMHSAVKGCGTCYECMRGQANWCPTYPSTREAVPPYFVGTFADYYHLPGGHPVFKVPNEVPDSVLPSVNCAMGTVTEGLIQAEAGPGHNVVLFGAGGLGLYATVMARHRGVDQIIIADRIPERLALAEEFGADHTINIDECATAEDRRDRVLALTQGRGADIVMELVGNAALLSEGLDFLAPGGRFVQIGAAQGASASLNPAQLLRGKRIIGNLMYRSQVLPMLLDFLARNHARLPFEKILSHRYPLERINDAFEAADWQARQTHVTRAVIVP